MTCDIGNASGSSHDASLAAGPQAARELPAATVLFMPEYELVDRLISALDHGGRRWYLFLNGPIPENVRARIARVANRVVIESPSNRGHGAALNTLMEHAARDGYRDLLLFDQDSSPTLDLPEALLRSRADLARCFPRVAVVGPTLIPPDAGDFLPVRYSWRRDFRGAAHFVPTSGSLISIAAWQEVGPFREDYFIGGIDVEWSLRAWAKGFVLKVDPDLKLQHRWGVQAPPKFFMRWQIVRSPDDRNYYYIRNMVDCLGQKSLPLAWRIPRGLRLLAQLALLLHARGYSRATVALIRQAIADGRKIRRG